MSTIQDALQKIEIAVFADELPSEPSLAAYNFDNLLDARDADGFAGPWTSAYNTVSNLYPASDPSVKQRIDKVREHVYKRVYNKTQVSDLASYTSDDFDMVLRYLVTNTASEWVNALWLSYKNGAIPSGTLTEHRGDLPGLITS